MKHIEIYTDGACSGCAVFLRFGLNSSIENLRIVVFPGWCLPSAGTGSLKSGCDLCILRADAPMPNGMGAESPPEKTRPGPIKHTMQLHSIIIGNGVYVKYLAL